MLKADKLRFEQLRSPDEAVRVAAATQLEQKRREYFFKNAITLPMHSGHHAEWVRSYRETKSEVVKAWVVRALVQSDAQGQDVAEVLIDELRPDHPYLKQILHYAGYQMHKVPGSTKRMLALHDHPDRDVRFWAADALCSFQRVHGGLDYDSDAPVLRKLIVEGMYPAVGALEAFGKLEAADREALQETIRRDPGGNTAAHARKLLEKYP
jgi:hypothetical protein